MAGAASQMRPSQKNTALKEPGSYCTFAAVNAAQDLDIRQGTPADLDTVAQFHQALYVEHFQATVSGAAKTTALFRDMETTLQADAKAMLSQPKKFAVFIARRNAREIGYISGSIQTDSRRDLKTRGIIGDWFVDTRMRSRGVGKALYDALEIWFLERGCSAVESSTWAQNEGALTAHTALGFERARIVFRKVL